MDANSWYWTNFSTELPKFQHTLGIDFNWTIPINELSQGLKRKKAVASATAIVAVATLPSLKACRRELSLLELRQWQSSHP